MKPPPSPAHRVPPDVPAANGVVVVGDVVQQRHQQVAEDAADDRADHPAAARGAAQVDAPRRRLQLLRDTRVPAAGEVSLLMLVLTVSSQADGFLGYFRIKMIQKI